MAEFYASDWYVLEARNEGYYVGAGCAITASGTAGKVDMSAGITLQGAVEVNAAAVTAASTTITSLADGSNPKWVGLEIDSAGALQFNAGTAAANPEKPTPTSARVMVAWLYVPASATAVDALTSNANGKAKIIDARQLVTSTPSPTGWQYEQDTWVYGLGTSSVISCVGIIGDKSGTYRPGTKLSWNDGTNTPGYGVVYTASVGATLTSVSSNTTTNVFTKTAHGFSNLNLSCIVITAGLSNTTGISMNTLYWVNYVDANTFTLALTIGGTAIDITGTADTNLTFSPATSVFMIPSSDYYVRNATISRPRYSYSAAPQGVPGWFNWTPTLVGWTSSIAARWKADGRSLLLSITSYVVGSSSSTAHTLSLPVAAASVNANAYFSAWCFGQDNGVSQTGLWQIAPGGSVLNIYGKIVTGTASNTAGATPASSSGQIVYEF